MGFEEIKKLYKITDTRFGYSPSEVKAKENELRFKFPRVLANFYQKLGKNKIIVFGESPKGLEELSVNDEGYLEIYIDNQTGERWAINSKENKPKLLYKPLKKEWIPVQVSLQDFLLCQMLWASCTRLEFYAIGNFSKEVIKKEIERNVLTRLQVDSEFKNVMFYQKSENDIIGVNGSSIFLGSNNEINFKKAMSIFGNDWFSVSNENTTLPNFD